MSDADVFNFEGGIQLEEGEDTGHLAGFTPPPSHDEQEPASAEDYDYSLHYFRADPDKRIDFVLSYREVIEDLEECGEKTPIQKTGKELDAKKKRRIFEENLERKGLSIERETYDKNEGSDIKRIVYVKVHATKQCLFEYAEHLQVKKLLKIDPMKIFRDEYKEERSWFDWKLFSSLHRGEKFYKDEIWDEMKNHKISARFAQNKAERFINHDEPGFFTTGERSYIVSYILEETPFTEENKSGQKDNVGIEYLLQDDVYSAWYPLHDGPYELPNVEDRPEDEKVFLNDRQVLSMFWSDWGRWYKYQPLNRVRIYFGDTVAMYFAWLGFYTKLLIVPAVVGSIVFAYDIYSIIGNEVVDAVCDENSSNTEAHSPICPACDEECDIVDLKSFCNLFMVANAFNNGGSVFFAIFISFWSAFFLEFWKRYQITLAFLWSKADFTDAQEPARPEYAVTCEEDDVRFNPITLRFEPYREPSIFKTITAVSVVIITVIVVIITLISIIIYKIAVYSIFDHMSNGSLKPYAATLSSVSGSILQLIAITVLSQVYAWLAEKITLWENYRTETEFQNNLTVKRFIFEFFNYYGSCFYIAFVKGNFAGTPYNYTRIFGIRLDTCGPGGCLGELAENLAIIFLGKQIMNNFQELLIPMMKSWWSRRKSNQYQSGTDKEQISISMTTPWEADNDLAEQENLFPEYLEMVIQYGFATMFVVAFPVAPLFALINNVVEIRLDAKKYTELLKRPIPINCMSIGIWYGILDYMASIAIITNAFVIAFTSDFVSQILWKYNHDDGLATYVKGHLSSFTGPILNDLGEEVIDTCKYWDYRLEKGETSLWWWKLKAVQFIFVVVFEHFVFTIVRLIDLLIPDVPEKLEALIHLEDSFAREMMKEVIEIDLEKLEDVRNRVKVKKRQRQKYD
ncbi:anoctamin-7-like isoform X2 [Bolinopsis microptera]|uniref:anoctamin-7-like isoform X2 n=1 Tax=Bolinopsis microptera TaxID=2820187 RepID=UPI00307A7FCE